MNHSGKTERKEGRKEDLGWGGAVMLTVGSGRAFSFLSYTCPDFVSKHVSPGKVLGKS